MEDKQFIADDYSKISAAVSYLTGVEVSTDKPIEVLIRPYKKQRSIPSNNLSHIWYADISKARGESPEQSKCYCKLHFGVPILRAESDQFRMLYDRAIKGAFSYEEKLEVMKILPVTSLMDKDQMNWYLHSMQMTMAQKENIILMSPMDSEYYAWSQQI